MQVHMSATSVRATRCSSEVEAEVLEGLCPPVGLVTLDIRDYDGLVYPKWMVGRQNGGPEKLQQLGLSGWSQPGPAPALKASNPLRKLFVWICNGKEHLARQYGAPQLARSTNHY